MLPEIFTSVASKAASISCNPAIWFNKAKRSKKRFAVVCFCAAIRYRSISVSLKSTSSVKVLLLDKRTSYTIGKEYVTLSTRTDNKRFEIISSRN